MDQGFSFRSQHVAAIPLFPFFRLRRRPAQAGWDPIALAALASLWIAGPANLPLWRALHGLPELASLRGAVFMLGFGAVNALLMTALLGFFAWRRSIKPVLAVTLLVAAGGAHFMNTYGVVIDPTMMTSALQTDPAEVRDLLGLRMVVMVGGLAGLPMLWLWRTPVRLLPPGRQAGRNAAGVVIALMLAALVCMGLFSDIAATMRNHKSVRYLINPLNSFYALGVVAARAGARPPGPPEPVGLDAHLLPQPRGARPALVLLVVGETARADHFSLNGYARPTNPELARREVVSFSQVSSCGTHTAASLPCMFSPLGRKAFEASNRPQQNLLDVLQRAGLAVLWIDNQSGCKGVCDRVPHGQAHEAVAGMPAPSAELCRDGECPDEVLLQGLDARIAALDPLRRARGLVVVLHQMGSHGPAYFLRSPPSRKPFGPECTTNVLQNCERLPLVNAYDNSIAYTDHVLARAIDWLQAHREAYDPALLYVSDHGESLGENGLYLHGMPYALSPKEQTHVPLLTWWPAQTEARLGVSLPCLRSRRALPLSHDHLFHTLLGLTGVRAREYRASLDLLEPCRAA